MLKWKASYTMQIKNMAKNTKQLLYLRPMYQQYSKKCMTDVVIVG